MERRMGANIIIEAEKIGKKTVFIASSPDINIITEGRTIEKVKENFLKALHLHIKTFPEDIKLLKIEQECEVPILTRIFL